MSKVILYIERGPDGYIARENGEFDWLWGDSEEDYGFDSFFSSIDTVFLGRKTYEQIFELADEFPFKTQDVYVVSNEREGVDDFATYIQPEQISPLINLLKKNQNKNIWITGGAQLLHHFIDSGLPDEYQIALQPTSVGNEVSLFQTNELEEELFLVDVKQIKDGKFMLTCIHDGGIS